MGLVNRLQFHGRLLQKIKSWKSGTAPQNLLPLHVQFATLNRFIPPWSWQHHHSYHSVLPAFLSFFASFLPSILTASLNLLAPVLHLDAWQTNINKAVWWQHTGPSAGAVHAAYAACKLTSVPACVYGHAFYACASICVHVQCLLSPWAVASVNHELDIFALEHKNCECKICAGYQHWRPFKNWND